VLWHQKESIISSEVFPKIRAKKSVEISVFIGFVDKEVCFFRQPYCLLECLVSDSIFSQTAWSYPFWIAHRGAGLLAPENTLSAFKLGAGHGFQMFECDVKLSADAVCFLLHDTTLERTTNGSGRAADQTWGCLSQLDAGSWHSSAYAGEPLPTLAAIARYVQAHDLLLNIEIKPTPGLEAETGAAVAQAVLALWPASRTPPLLTSFRPESLAAAQRQAPHIPRGLLLDTLWHGWLEVAQELACTAIVCKYTLWDAAAVQAVHGVGMRCLSYTVNNAHAAQELIDLGTDGIITDCVDVLGPR
jgi:glycerophosphoryl diester phosphodiesterase